MIEVEQKQNYPTQFATDDDYIARRGRRAVKLWSCQDRSPGRAEPSPRNRYRLYTSAAAGPTRVPLGVRE